MSFTSCIPRRRFLGLAAAGTSSLLLWPSQLLDGLEGWALVPEILAHIHPPVFPKRDFALTT